MIRSAKEAREIFSDFKIWGINCRHSSERISEAEGYLACLEGPEVKALVESLRKIAEEVDARYSIGKEWRQIARNALAQYREATDQGGTK